MTKNDLKIVFFGTPDFAVESLKLLVDNGYNIAAVVTATDKPAGRGHHLLQSAVKRYALEHNLPVLQPEKLRDNEFVEQLRAINADLFIVIAFRMLPQVIWQMPRLGTFNLHASLLPRYRGAAPINWAVINGDKRTGVTTFFLKHEIDTGDIIAQEAIDITPDDNAGTVHDRLMTLGAALTLRTVEDIIAGTLTTTPQSQLVGDVEPTPAPKIFAETCQIDWTKSADEVVNLIRGLSPYPAARASLQGMAVKITKARATGTCSLAAGEGRVDGSLLLVGTARGDVEVLELQPSGKRSMAAADYLRGARLPENFEWQ